MNNDENRWKPRSRLGGIYCSPACGGGCTRADYDRAVRASKALAERMGEGWEPQVWENLGWYCAVKKGIASIRPPSRNYDNKYTIYFNTTPQVVTSAETPEDALGFALQEARGNELRIATDCAALSQ